jgi:hypothetical protein
MASPQAPSKKNNQCYTFNSLCTCEYHIHNTSFPQFLLSHMLHVYILTLWKPQILNPSTLFQSFKWTFTKCYVYQCNNSSLLFQETAYRIFVRNLHVDGRTVIKCILKIQSNWTDTAQDRVYWHTYAIIKLNLHST